MKYVVAIPTYNRETVIETKTLTTLLDGGVSPKQIFLFVANQQQAARYKDAVPSTKYNRIVVGKKGITNQRIFISQYFKEGKYVVSIDDDVEGLLELDGPTKLKPLHNLDTFFKEAYNVLRKHGLYLWGIYPVSNSFYMYPTVTTDLKFIIGVLHGYIVRHDKTLQPSTRAETKEDYETSILYYMNDGGVVRFNYITPKTKFLAEGGLGPERIQVSLDAATYLNETYPSLVSRVFKRDNGQTEIRLAKLPCFTNPPPP